MPIVKKEKWNNYVKKNKEPYGKCCVDIAREVMHLLDEPNKGYENIDSRRIICEAEKNIGESGITGFMASAVASMVSQCHSRGAEMSLKKEEEKK